MRHTTLWTLALALALLLGAVALRAASGDEPVPNAARLGEIPAHRAWQERVVSVPEVTREERVPVYENVKVPVYATQRVPITEEREVPVYETRTVPVMEERRVPEHGPVTVPVYQQVREPVTLSLPNPFGCEDLCLELWDRCCCVQTGTRVEQGVVGWRLEQVQVGTREERVATGATRTETVTVGERSVAVVVGEREERRLTGTTTRVVVVQPATTRRVVQCVDLPLERVTVVVDADARPEAPLPGTTRVLTETEFQRAALLAR